MMKQFVDLYFKLLESEGLTLKLKFILAYLRSASEKDCEIAVWLLNGNKLNTHINFQILKKWILAETSVPLWLFEESLNVVKDPEETLSLITEPGNESSPLSLTDWIQENVTPLKGMELNDQRDFILKRFTNLRQKYRFIFLKLLTGKLKLCSDKKTLVKALCSYSKLDEEIITYRISNYNFPEPGCYARLIEMNNLEISGCRPYQFMPASQLDNSQYQQLKMECLIAEWKWKGTRAQVVKRNGKVYIWSKSHEYLSDKFPDLVKEFSALPDNLVLDGQLTSQSDPEAIYKRINNKISGSIINKYPVRFIVFDILECKSLDVRMLPLCERKNFLSEIFSSYSLSCVQPAEYFYVKNNEDLNLIRSGINSVFAEGLLIKDQHSSYLYSDNIASWYSLKKERSKFYAALMYIQREYQNYEPGVNSIKIMTFGATDGDNLVSVAKADCNLSENELIELEHYIKENTVERVGPIRVLKPGLIFELTYDEILTSKRHKSGINITSPQISRWMKQLTLKDIDRIEYLRNSAL